MNCKSFTIHSTHPPPQHLRVSPSSYCVPPVAQPKSMTDQVGKGEQWEKLVSLNEEIENRAKENSIAKSRRGRVSSAEAYSSSIRFVSSSSTKSVRRSFYSVDSSMVDAFSSMTVYRVMLG